MGSSWSRGSEAGGVPLPASLPQPCARAGNQGLARRSSTLGCVGRLSLVISYLPILWPFVPFVPLFSCQNLKYAFLCWTKYKNRSGQQPKVSKKEPEHWSVLQQLHPQALPKRPLVVAPTCPPQATGISPSLSPAPGALNVPSLAAHLFWAVYTCNSKSHY